MDSTVKKVIAIVVVAVVTAVAVYGSYLPMRKAQIFIDTLQTLQTTPASSLQDLENRVSVPLDYTSPIGQEELVRNFANSVLAFEQQGIDATSTLALTSYLNTYYDPIISRGKGMSFGQDLYLLGAINEIAFSSTGDPRYLEAAQTYYEEGEKLGPNRPQPLFGLFDVYRTTGNVTGTEMVANTILKNWPTETSVQQALAQFMSEVQAVQLGSSTKNSAKK